MRRVPEKRTRVPQMSVKFHSLLFIFWCLYVRHYFWDDPHLYKEGVDGIMRRCVPEYEQQEILRKCHGSAYGGHHAGDRTAQKVLQSGFYWPTLFKDARKFILSCDECQRVGNISRHNEVPMNYSLVIESYDC